MSKTLTVRTDDALHEALRNRTEAQGKAVSEVVREILEDALTERPLASKIGHLKGCLTLPSPTDP